MSTAVREFKRRYEMELALERAHVLSLNGNASDGNREERRKLILELQSLDTAHNLEWLDTLIDYEIDGMLRENDKTDEIVDEQRTIVCTGTQCREGGVVYCSTCTASSAVRVKPRALHIYDCWSTLLHDTVLYGMQVPEYAQWFQRRRTRCAEKTPANQTPVMYRLLEIWCRWFPLMSEQSLLAMPSPLSTESLFTLFMHAWATTRCHDVDYWCAVWYEWYVYWTGLYIEKSVRKPPNDLYTLIYSWSDGPSWMTGRLLSELAPQTVHRGLLPDSLSRLLGTHSPQLNITQWPVVLSFLVLATPVKECTRTVNVERRSSLIVQPHDNQKHQIGEVLAVWLPATWPIDYVVPLMTRLESVSVGMLHTSITSRNFGYDDKTTTRCGVCSRTVQHLSTCGALQHAPLHAPYAALWEDGHWMKVIATVECSIRIGQPVALCCSKPLFLERQLLDWYAKRPLLSDNWLSDAVSSYQSVMLPEMWSTVKQYLTYSLFDVVSIFS